MRERVLQSSTEGSCPELLFERRQVAASYRAFFLCLLKYRLNSATGGGSIVSFNFLTVADLEGPGLEYLDESHN